MYIQLELHCRALYRRGMKRLASSAGFVRLCHDCRKGKSFGYQSLKDRNRKFRSAHEKETDFAGSYVSHSPCFTSFLIFRLIRSRLRKLK